MKNKGWEAESDKQERNGRQRTWGLAGSSLAILLMVLFAAVNGWARDQIKEDASERLGLTLLVHICAPISQHDLAEAEGVASEIYQKVGVELSWVDLPQTGPKAQRNPVSTAPHTPTDIRLNIVPDLPKGAGVGKFVMGLAMSAPPPDHGQLAYVSYVRARLVLLDHPDLPLTLGQLLGYGIAHEIGHLLLGTNSHSPSGLMSAHWRGGELLLAGRGQLNFSMDQAMTIRGDVRARRAQQEAAALVLMAFQK